MTRRDNTCEGSNGTAISNLNTAPDQWSAVTKSGTGTTLNFATAQKHSGSSSALMHLASGVTSTDYMEWSGQSSTANAYARVYLYRSANTPSVVRIFSFLGSGAVRCSLAILASGAIRTLNAAGTTVASTTATMPLNAWSRIEFEVTGISAGVATVAARIYSGANLETGTPDTNGSLSTAGVTVNGNVDDLRVGASVGVYESSAWDLYIDDVAYSDAAQPGPLATNATITSPCVAATTSIPAPSVSAVSSATISASVIQATTLVHAPRSYPLVLCALNPAVYLPLNDPSGTVATDASGNARDGTYGGAPTLGATGLLTGDSDAAVTLNGSSQYVTIAYGAWLNVADFTVAILASITGLSKTFADRDNASAQKIWGMSTDASGHAVFSTFAAIGGAGQPTTSPGVINDSTRHLIIGVKSGSVMTLYVDGGTADVHSYPDFASATSQGIDLGRRGNASGYVAGTLDEFAFVPAALTADDVMALWNAATGGGSALIKPSVVACTTSIPTPSVTASGTNATITASVVACTTSVPAPTTSAVSSRTITAAVLALTISVPAPTVSAVSSVTITATRVACSTSIPAPSVSAVSSRTITPPALTATTALPAPSVIASSPATITASVVSCTLVVPAPSVSAGRSVTISPAALACTTSVPAPSVSAVSSATISPAPLSCLASVPVPTVSAASSTTITAPAVLCGLALPGASLSTGTAVSPASVALSVAVSAPDVRTGTTAAPDALDVTTIIPAPDARAGSTISADALSTTAAVPAPDVSAVSAAMISADLVSCTTTVPSIAVAVEALISPDPLLISTDVPAGDVRSGCGIDAAAALVSVIFPQPSIITGSAVTISASPVLASTTLPDPSITAETHVDATITAELLSVSVELLEVEICTGTTIQADPLPLAAQILTPLVSVTAPTVILAPGVELLAEIPAPDVASGTTAAPVAIHAAIIVPVPVVTISEGVTITASVVAATLAVIEPVLTAGTGATLNAVVVASVVEIFEPQLAIETHALITTNVVAVAVRFGHVRVILVSTGPAEQLPIAALAARGWAGRVDTQPAEAAALHGRRWEGDVEQQEEISADTSARGWSSELPERS